VRIAVDAMGGDFAPAEVVVGARAAVRELDVEVTVVGLEESLRPLLKPDDGLNFVPATQVVEMGDHPARAVHSKRDSSMAVCARLCKDGQAAGWISAGNTGGVMAAALMLQGRLPGVQRPALGTVLPTRTGSCYLVDVGANVGCRPEYLVQFAQMGSVYVERVMGRPSPTVGLLSNGEEEGKGDSLVREAHDLLRRHQDLHFIGNLEPRDVLAGKADVVICDGFVGNIAIKMAESTAEFIFQAMRQEIPKTWRGKIGGALIRPSVAAIRSGMDWREFGGAPLLGIDGVAVVAHGRSDGRAIKNAVRVAKQSVGVNLVDNIREAVGR